MRRRGTLSIAAMAMTAMLAILPACSSPRTVSQGSAENAWLPDCVPSERAPERSTNGPVLSRLDEAGLAEIHATCQATFDLSKGELLKKDVGLGPADYMPDIANFGVISLRLIGPNGTLNARTDRVRFLSYESRQAPDVETITYFLTADTPDKLFAIIRAGIDAYGFDREVAERWIEDTQRQLDEPDEYGYIVGDSYALGFYISYDVRYRGPGHINTIIVTIGPGDTEPPAPATTDPSPQPSSLAGARRPGQFTPRTGSPGPGG